MHEGYTRLTLKDRPVEREKLELMNNAWTRILEYLRDREKIDKLVEGNSMNLQDVEVICDTLDSLEQVDGRVSFAELLLALKQMCGGRCASSIPVGKYFKERYGNVFEKDGTGTYNKISQDYIESVGGRGDSGEQRAVLHEDNASEEGEILQPAPPRKKTGDLLYP